MKSYRFADGEFEVRNEIKHSIFIATIKGEVDDDEAEEFVKKIRSRHPDATHNCYAYISDALGNKTRFSDDGEPGGTAGQPILDVIKKSGLVKTAIVVTRYFGGIKLGAGGLVGAYSGAAAMAVKMAKISEKVECRTIKISADYSDYSLIDKLTRKSECKVKEVEYGDMVTALIVVKDDEAEAFCESVQAATGARAKAEILNGKTFESIN